jgi:hypothetical protein
MKKSKSGGLSVSELKRNRELEAENAKLKRMYADLALENTALGSDRNKALRPPEKRVPPRDPMPLVVPESSGSTAPIETRCSTPGCSERSTKCAN